MLQMSGKFDSSRFSVNERGIQRWQRVPETEKRGRVQSSTITIACMPVPINSQTIIQEKDLEWLYCRGSGNGGQHRQKTESAVTVKHIPTGLTAHAESERSQPQNKRSALAVLTARIQESTKKCDTGKVNAQRQSQIGGAYRGEKRRTIALQRDQVVDHVTGKRMSAKEYLRGFIELVW